MAVEQFPAAQTALEEYQSIEQQMASPEVVTNPDKMRKLGRRHAELGAIVSAYQSYTAVRDDLEAAREMAGEDPEFADEAKRLEAELPAAEEKLRNALIPRDPDDARDVIMEIKAGTGGEEAALFAGDLLRMYLRYAEKRGWAVTVQSENTTELGGVKDVQIAIRAKGTPAPEDGVWASLKYEGGVHRVQRIPVTESQGRIQTSAARGRRGRRRDRDRSEGPENRHLHELRSRRTVREHHVLRRAHDAHPHWHRGEHAG